MKMAAQPSFGSVASATDGRDAELTEIADRFAVAITPLMQELIDAEAAGGPITAQFVPDKRELRRDPGEHPDPIGDVPNSPVVGIVHRYPDRVLLTPVRICPVYCRFCFRRETVGKAADAMLSESEMTAAIDYIRDHCDIWEVILSGGDPLILSPRRLDAILVELRRIDHVRVIRIHTRVPLVAAERINDALLASLRRASPLFVVLHVNHADEFTEQGEDACAKLVDAGIPMLAQSVLLKDVNDNARELERLLRRSVENRIKPYYLHHADAAPGTRHFRTTIEKGQELSAQIHGRLSGICRPTYVLDIPGGYGKSPIGPSYLERRSEGWVIDDFRGVSHLLSRE